MARPQCDIPLCLNGGKFACKMVERPFSHVMKAFFCGGGGFKIQRKKAHSGELLYNMDKLSIRHMQHIFFILSKLMYLACKLRPFCNEDLNWIDLLLG